MKWFLTVYMNSTSFLLCLVFAAIGYVAHPMLLSSMVSSKMVSENALSFEYLDKLRSESGYVAPSGSDVVVDDDPVDDPAVKPNDPVVTEVVPDPEPVLPDPDINVEEALVLTDSQFEDALKASVKSGDVTEFNYEQVLKWEREGEVEVDGDIYGVGMVTYQADTIFDEQQLKAKALIQDGKVVRWLWPTTNTTMK